MAQTQKNSAADFSTEEDFYNTLTGHCLVDDCPRIHHRVKPSAPKRLALKKTTEIFIPEVLQAPSTEVAPPKKSLKTGSQSFNLNGSDPVAQKPLQVPIKDSLMTNLGASVNQNLISNMTPQVNANAGYNNFGNQGQMNNQMYGMINNQQMQNNNYYNPNFYQQPTPQMQNFYMNQQQQQQQMIMQEMMMMNQMEGNQGFSDEEDYEDEEYHDPNEIVPECIECQCCNGKPYGCQGDLMCSEMGQCYCLIQLETEKKIEHNQNFYADNMKDCECCRGYIYNCKNEMCRKLEVCHCVIRTEMEDESVF